MRDDYQALRGKRWEELFHRPASRPLSKAKADRAECVAEIESRFATLRAQQRSEGHDQPRALAGEWCRWFVSQHEENPGDPDGRLECQWAVTDEIEAAVGGDPNEIDLGAPEICKKIRPIVADKAEAALFLASKGEALTPAARMVEHRHVSGTAARLRTHPDLMMLAFAQIDKELPRTLAYQIDLGLLDEVQGICERAARGSTRTSILRSYMSSE